MSDEVKVNKSLITKQIKRLGRLDVGMIACRVGGIRHHWHMVKPDWVPGSSGLKAIAMQCLNCLAVKRMEVDAKYGLVIGDPKYEYPDGYLIHRTEGDGTEQLVSPNAVRATMAKLPVEDELIPLEHEPK